MTRKPGFALSEHVRISHVVTGSLLAAGSTLAFVAGARVQRADSPSAHGVTHSVQLAQRTADHGSAAFAGSRRRAAASDSDDDDAPAATLETVYSLVKEHYVDTLPDDHTLSEGAVRSLLTALHDPNAYYLTPDQRDLVDNEAHGKFAGIGAAITVRPVSTNGYTEHKIEIVSAYPGSPAEKAGLRPHDIITRIGGKWILGSDPYLKVDNLVARLQAEHQSSDTEEVQRETDEARRRAHGGIGLVRAQMALRGDESALTLYHLPPNQITLSVLSPGATAARTATMDMTVTDASQIRVASGGNGLSVIKIPSFTDSTFEAVRKAIDRASVATGIVLDLRGNAGGVGNSTTAMKAAQKLDSLVCRAGDGVSPDFANERLAAGRKVTLKLASVDSGKDDSCSVIPIVVLVDNGTAGAAEALAAALEDAGRATIVGRQTFGYNGVQTLYPLPDGSALALSTGELSSPKRTNWAGRGLVPKVVLPSGASDGDILNKAAQLLASSTRIAAAPH